MTTPFTAIQMDQKSMISGCGFIYNGKNEEPKGEGHKGLGKFSTVYQCEIKAIDDATSHMLESNIENRNINYFIDNQAAIKSLDNYIVTSKLVAECKEKINRLGTNNKITLNWIKSHIGFEGNETADRYAKLGTNLEIDDEDEPILPVSPQVIKKLIERWAEKKHKRRWQSKTKHILETHDYSHTKIFIKEPNAKIWKTL